RSGPHGRAGGAGRGDKGHRRQRGRLLDHRGVL
ncbi:MAG: hypothetical protein AVDCRST_MAG91-3251, partial [uncultured Sphingomonadaceae bacterium]